MSEEDFAHTTSVELFYNSVMRELFWEQTAHLAVLKAFNFSATTLTTGLRMIGGSPTIIAHAALVSFYSEVQRLSIRGFRSSAGLPTRALLLFPLNGDRSIAAQVNPALEGAVTEIYSFDGQGFDVA